MSRFTGNCNRLSNVCKAAQNFSSISAALKNLKNKNFQPENTLQWRKLSGTLSGGRDENCILNVGNEIFLPEQTDEEIDMERVFDTNPKFADTTKKEEHTAAPKAPTDPGEEARRHVNALHTSVSNKNGRKAKSADGGGTEIELKVPYKLYCLEEGPSMKVKLNKADAMKYYQLMTSIRRMEAASDAMYKAKVIRGFCHLYSGEEACAVGLKAAINDKDKVITAYRAHGWTYLMGVSALGVLAELTGRVSGCSKGKGGSMHTYGVNFYGGNGIVGSPVPLGTGLALHAKLTANDAVSITCYGDGAANQGQVAEAFNIAYLWKLPVVYVCENNQYGMGTATKRASANHEYYTRGDLIPGIWVNGMDVLAVRNAAEFAIDYVLKNGPIILELHTYRYSGHSMSDPGLVYRPRKEVQDIRAKSDPIQNFKQVLLDYKILTESEIKEIEAKCKAEIEDAVNKSKTDPEVSLAELTYDLYIKALEPNIRNTTGYTSPHKLTNKESLEKLAKWHEVPKKGTVWGGDKKPDAQPQKLT